MIRQYLRNIAVALDQLLNALLGGDPDETISSRAAKSLHRPYWALLALLLERIDRGHLARSREDDEGGDALWPGRRAGRGRPRDRQDTER